MAIEITPATLKINEKPRKYHLSFSQSTLTLRNNSTGSLPFLGLKPSWASAFIKLTPASPFPIHGSVFQGDETRCPRRRQLDRDRFTRFQPAQVPVEDHPGHVDRRKEVGGETESKGKGKALHRSAAEQKQNGS